MKKANNDFLTLTAAVAVIIVAAFVIMTSVGSNSRGTITPSDLTVLGADTSDLATEAEFEELSQEAAGL